jgi:mxaJ protein
VYGDYRTDSPPSAIVAAVARGEIDIAAAWGPLAGYYATRQSEALDIVPVSPQMDGPSLPQVFDISMAVRRREPEWLARLNRFIGEHRREINALLDEYHVPRVTP